MATESQLPAQQKSEGLEASIHTEGAASESDKEMPLRSKTKRRSEAQREHAAVRGDEDSQQGDGDEHKEVAARYGSAGKAQRQQRTRVASQRRQWFQISSLANVPHVPDLDFEEEILLEKCLWNVDADDIAVSICPRLSIVYPTMASSILGQERLSLENSMKLLRLGQKILSGVPIFEKRKLDNPQWKTYVKARALCLLVIQLDTLLRIASLFPKVTQIDQWWPLMVQKCNLEIIVQSSIDEVSVHLEAIQTSKAALKTLLQQRRPDITVLAYVYAYYQTVLTRGQAKHKKK